MSKYWNHALKWPDIKQGDHRPAFIKKLDREYQPRNEAEKRFRDKVLDELEKVVSGMSDIDTGYMYVESASPSNTYLVTHSLGAIPSKISMFFCTEEEPVDGKDEIYEIWPISSGNTGVMVKHTSKDKMVVTVGSTAVYDSETTGYLRILLWR